MLKAVIAALLLALTLAQATAAERRCLTPEERRQMVASRKVAPLGRILRAVRNRFGGEVVRVRLCERPRGPVYLLTVLARNGRVIRATVDARTGRFLGGR